MGTVTITGAGFSSLGASAPGNWPNNVTFPSGGSPNGSKVYTVSDADWLSLLTWIANTRRQDLAAVLNISTFNNSTVFTPTAAQILLAWIQGFLANPTIQGIQAFNTSQPVVPAPITMS